MDKLHTILIPIDFSPTADLAIDAGMGIARKYGAEVVILHVYTIPVYAFPDGAYVAPAATASDLSTAAQKGVDAVVSRLATQGVKVTSVLREGVPAEETASVAREVRADLLVVGTHARKGLARALLGSVAETVIRTVDVPVLVVHPPHKE